VLTRYLRGVADQARSMPHPERLARRTRGYQRLGSAIPKAVLERAKAAAADDEKALGRSFEGVDAVLTPMFTRRPLRVREYDGKSGLRTLAGQVRWTPYGGAFNHTGQPAVSVPAGFTSDGFPLAVQLVGPFESEARLFSLSAQLEQARRWYEARPAVAA
jgi:amidase